MTKQLLVSSALHQIGEDQMRHEKEYQKKFEHFSMRCKFRYMYKYSETRDPLPACRDKKDPYNWRCKLNDCPYIREARREQTGREELE